MPSFPEINPDITCDRALNMILASIAMEELALSHIINAEGEKLQYVLKKLEASCDKSQSVDDVLKVNQSVANLLESVSQNQMILKNKMDKALCALSEICPKPPCHPAPTYPPTGKDCHKCSAVFRAEEKCRPWCCGSELHWITERVNDRCVCVDSCDKTKIKLHSKGRFVVNFTVNLTSNECKSGAVIRLMMIKNHQRMDIYTIRGPMLCEGEAVTISMGGIIIESYDCASSLLMRLESPDLLIVEDSMLSIVEI